MRMGENQGGHPLVPPFQGGSTSMDTPKGEKEILSVVDTAKRRVSERLELPNTIEGSKRGARPLLSNLPLPLWGLCLASGTCPKSRQVASKVHSRRCLDAS